MKAHLPTVEQQEAAWFEYIERKRIADEAFERFKELYLADDRECGRIAPRTRADNVSTFPVHKTRPGRLTGRAR